MVPVQQDAGAKRKVRVARQDRRDDLWNLLRTLAAVRVDEHGDVGIRRERGDAGEAGSTVAAAGLAHDAGSCLPRRGPSRRWKHCRDDHFVDDVARHAPDELADHESLVERRDDQDRLHSAPTPARARRVSTDKARNARATANPRGATSTRRAHHGMAQGSARKKAYAKAMVPVKTIRGADGVIARRGTSHTAYHGKTFGDNAMKPDTRGTPRSARWAAPPRHATAITQAAVTVSASAGSFTSERTSPGLKYSSRT